MCCKRLKVTLRNRWLKRQFARVHAKYALRFQQVEAQKRSQVDIIWHTYQRSQIKDYVVCIDLRLHFIGSMLKLETIETIHKYKQVYYRKRDFKKIVALAEIVYQSDVESIETELLNLIQTGKRTWILWK
jgi:hypothetical protein